MQNNGLVDVGGDQTVLNVLVVEDDSLTASLLEYIFTRHGFVVQLARDGAEAQAIIHSNTAPPHVVVLDLILPYVDGYELLQLVRKTAAWQHVPVLIVSGKSQEEYVVRAFKLGASDFMVKPFHLNELIMRVTRLKNAGGIK